MIKISRKFIAFLAFSVLVLVLIYFIPKNDTKRNLIERDKSYKYDISKSVLKEKILHYYGNAEVDKSVGLVSEITGKVVNIKVKEGEFLKKNSIILEIDKKDFSEIVESTRADLISKEISYVSAKKMENSGLGAKINVATAKAELLKAKANLLRAEINLANCTVKAPYDGIINKIYVDKNSFVTPSVSIAEFLSDETMKIKFSIPIGEYKNVRQSKRICVYSDRKNKFCHHGVSHINHTAQNVSRLYEASVVVDNKELQLKNGQIVDIDVIVGVFDAHHVPQSSISLDYNGNIGMKIIDKNNIVQHKKIEIIDEDIDGYWVTGLPEEVKIITLGHHDLIDGYKIPNSVE